MQAFIALCLTFKSESAWRQMSATRAIDLSAISRINMTAVAYKEVQMNTQTIAYQVHMLLMKRVDAWIFNLETIHMIMQPF